ncbi:hypothetical protein, partial [Haliangium sp.]|uniref:hypothetical protein n=1 Tax=Haliangium sp. TaxID=2663208 RepID=UPI003D0BAF1B
ASTCALLDLTGWGLPGRGVSSGSTPFYTTEWPFSPAQAVEVMQLTGGRCHLGEVPFDRLHQTTFDE